MLEAVKKALRISHSQLDSEIESTIAGARLELTRAGVSNDAITENDELIQRAIITYCQMFFSNNDKMAEGYQKSFQYQLDNLRKSTKYHV